MSRKRSHPEHENHERWLISYADFITLLFAFFVVMFASSQTDKARAQQVSDSVKDAIDKGGVRPVVHMLLGGTVDDKGQGNAMMRGPGGSNAKVEPPPAETLAELAPSMSYLTKALESEIQSGKIDIHMEPRGLVISLRQATFFPSGEDRIDPGTYGSLDKIAAVVKDLPNSVRMEGHTDAVPIHTERFRSNWELSAARAIAMLELLASRYRIPVSRLAIAGYADTLPSDSNDTAEGRAHNRRVDIIILNQLVAVKASSAAEPTAAAHKKKQ